MIKQTKFHHSVTELGNLQLRQVAEYTKNGKVKDKKYSHPMTPADPKNMTGWDDRSKDIVAAITDSKVLADFAKKNKNRVNTVSPDDTLVESILYDRVIEEDGKIAVRRITRIYDDGVEVSKKYHRSWIMPGDDPTGKDVISKAVAQKLHTPECIVAYQAKLAKQEVI